MIIAFYLPQYHPTPNNNEWWGQGFTEWTNVAKARPLFRGHYQPKIPADLGFYDLRLPETRKAQAEMAREYGIDGFCYYHYWFGNGHRELHLPFDEVLASGEPDFPFMLCWANESWAKKFWSNDGSNSHRKVLAEQTYPEGDAEKHFMHLLPAFKDSRYIRIESKPAFMVYKPFDHPDMGGFIKKWNQLAQENGLEGIYFMCQLQLDITEDKIDKLIAMGFDAVNTSRLFDVWLYKRSFAKRAAGALKTMFTGIPGAKEYIDLYPRFIQEPEHREDVIPTMMPNWDHTPRSGAKGTVMTGCTPERFEDHARRVLECVKHKKQPIAFLKSWNEWGEGNYVEPDLRYGRGFLEALKSAINKYR